MPPGIAWGKGPGQCASHGPSRRPLSAGSQSRRRRPDVSDESRNLAGIKARPRTGPISIAPTSTTDRSCTSGSGPDDSPPAGRRARPTRAKVRGWPARRSAQPERCQPKITASAQARTDGVQSFPESLQQLLDQRGIRPNRARHGRHRRESLAVAIRSQSPANLPGSCRLPSTRATSFRRAGASRPDGSRGSRCRCSATDAGHARRRDNRGRRRVLVWMGHPRRRCPGSAHPS